MDEITFEDVLTHYQLKLREVSDEVEALRNLLKKAQESVAYGWKGQASDACSLKLEDIDTQLTKTLSEISEALVKLSAISELMAEEDVVVI